METLINYLKTEGINYTITRYPSIGMALLCSAIIAFSILLGMWIVFKVEKILINHAIPSLIQLPIFALCLLMITLPVSYVAVNAYENRNSDIKSVTFTCSDEQCAKLEEMGYSLQTAEHEVEYVYYGQDEKGE